MKVFQSFINLKSSQSKKASQSFDSTFDGLSFLSSLHEYDETWAIKYEYTAFRSPSNELKLASNLVSSPFTELGGLTADMIRVCIKYIIINTIIIYHKNIQYCVGFPL